MKRQRPEDLRHEFKPQPFEQLAKVLRETGHAEDAKRIAILKQKFQRRSDWLQAASGWRERWWHPSEIWNLSATLVRCAFSHLFQWVVGFGYRPFYALLWLAPFWTAGACIFAWADHDGSMVQNNPFVVRSDDWMYCLWQEEAGQVTAAECWLLMQQEDEKSYGQVRGKDFPRLSTIAYSLDTFVPFVDLHQEVHWIPKADRGDAPLLGKPAGWWARLYLWIHISVGWAVTALFAASLTGLVKTDV